ncbi:MAG: V-type ATPase subunit [Dehalococcoidales bacterium]|nr:V-type ATPase subunit [Dehalococcoidales bacterium]
MSASDYAFMTAYLKGEEIGLLTTDLVNRLSRTGSVADVLDAIRNTDIGVYLGDAPLKTFDDIDEYLWRHLADCLERIKWFKRVPAGMLRLLDAYTSKYDVFNIKVALQGILTGKRLRGIPIGAIQNRGLLGELFEAKDVASMVELLDFKCKLGEYAAILAEHEIDGKVKLGLLTGARLDSQYYRELMEVARTTADGSILTRALAILIDLTNLQIVSRAVIGGLGIDTTEAIIPGGYLISERGAGELSGVKLSDLPEKLGITLYRDVVTELAGSYGSGKSRAVVDEIIDKYKFIMTRELLSPRILSPLVLVWYLLLKETEVRNLRLILKAAFDGMSLDRVRDSLVLPA